MDNKSGVFAFFLLLLLLDVSVVVVDAISCRVNGVCRDSGPYEAQTVCSGCKSCTYKNCCNKVYTSPYTQCTIPGWRASNYIGSVVLVPKSGMKRDTYCSKPSDCPKGSGCIVYNKNKPDGFCWKAPDGSTAGNSTLAFMAFLAGMFLLGI